MAEPVVSVEGLVKRYGEVAAVDGVSFEVQKGEIFALLGPNGAGKTTTIEMLECIRQPTAGSLKVLGHSVAASHGVNEIKKKIGVLPQEFSTLGRLTVAENLEFFAGLYDSSVDAMSLLDLLEIRDKAKVRFANLSRELKQKVGIAVALVNDPELILLDEPTTGLGFEIRRATWKVIKDLRAKGKTTILTTHYMEEAEQLADRIGILYRGKILALDTPAGLLGKFGGGRGVIFRNGGDAVFGTLRRFFDAVSMDGSDVVLPFDRLRDLEVALAALVDRGLEAEIALRSPTIEDVFLKLAGVKMSDTGEAS
ncbi:MAG: ABC transporter ATP-binding protein [Nitrososphaerales archaeon]|jgi:ABC-2 type transport system ATP-binding protein